MKNRRRSALSLLGLLVVAAAALAAFPEDADTPLEGWKYGFRSIIDTAQYPNAQDKEGASGMSLEAGWKDITHWPSPSGSHDDFSSLGRPDVVVGYIEGGVNYWRNRADELIKKIYLNQAEVMANPVCAGRYQDNGDPWFNVLDFPGTPNHNGNKQCVGGDRNGLLCTPGNDPNECPPAVGGGTCTGPFLDPEDLIIECSNGVDDDGNGYVDDISGWDFYNRQNNPHSQDVTYGHHNGQMLNGEAAINDPNADDPGVLGACPLCMVMPIRAGAEALDRTDDLAQAFLFAADSGAASVASLTADLGYSTFMRQAEEYLWRHDVLVAQASNDFDSTDHQGGMYWPHAVAGNGVVKDNEVSGLPVPDCFPSTNVCTGAATRTFRQRSGQTSWGTRHMVSVSGTTSTSASTGTLGGILGLLQSWNRTAVELGYIAPPLTGPEIVQLLIATASDIDPSDYTSVPNAWPTRVGWDLQTGYGRVNARRFQEELRLGNIRPVGWFDAPEWFSLYDPTVQSTVEIYGHTEARRSPTNTYSWTLEWALGAEPTAFQTLSSGMRTGAFDGKLGELDLSSISAAFYAQAFALSNNKELETTEKYTVTLRLRVTYDKSPGQPFTGEERRSILVHRDPDWMANFPRRIRTGAACAGGQIAAGAPSDYCFSPGGESQPALADLAGLGRLQIVFGDTDGYLHALDPTTGGELPGFPVTTDATVVMKPGGWSGVNPGFEPIPINVAVGDLDHDGNLWIVAATSTGKLYVWDAQGQRRAGWPQTPAEGVVPLESPRIPREFSRLPHQGIFAAPILADWDGDQQLEIVQAGYDGHIHLYRADGTEVTTGNWPIQVRVPDSVPITRPQLNNPAEMRTPIRMQDFRISSNPALAQLDDDPELEIVVRSQMSDTLPSDGIEVLSGVGHLLAYDHDGSLIPGWPAKMDSAAFYYGSAQEFITEGSNSPAVADIDGDGRDEIVSNAVFSLYEYPFKGNGTLFSASPWTNPPEGLPDPVLPIPDVPVAFTTSGAFGLFNGALTYAQAGSGASSIITALLSAGSGQPILNKERAWNALTGQVVPGFPAKLQGLNFLSAPLFVDITGDGLAEIIDGGDSSALHGFRAGGLQATLANFPKFTTGWILWSPTAGDLDSDGTVELVANTREGYTTVWKTPGLASANSEWWRYHHDEWNTGRYGTDTRPPGILRAPGLPGGQQIAFTAPGDDWYAGTPTKYRIVHDAGVMELPATASAGQVETLTIPAGIDHGTVQAVDDAGNLGRARSFDLGEGSIDGAALLSGKKLDLRDGADATHRRLTWVAKDARIALPEGDDRPTLAGATVRVLNPTTGESATLALPQPLWTQLANGSFRYRDPRFTMGPVRSALMRGGKFVKVNARGSEIHFTLDEPSQGSLGVVLRSGNRQYCTLFGGTVKADRPRRFLARSAPPPAGCPGG